MSNYIVLKFFQPTIIMTLIGGTPLLSIIVAQVTLKSWKRILGNLGRSELVSTLDENDTSFFFEYASITICFFVLCKIIMNTETILLKQIFNVEYNWIQVFEGVTPFGIIDLCDLSCDTLRFIELNYIKSSALTSSAQNYLLMIENIENKFCQGLGSISLLRKITMKNDLSEICSSPTTFPTRNLLLMDGSTISANFENVPKVGWNFIIELATILD